MKKFKLVGTHGRWITGFYMGVQIVPSVTIDYDGINIFAGERPTLVNSTDLMLIYHDESGCIWTEKIDAGDQIEFL